MAYGSNVDLDAYWTARGYTATLTGAEKDALRARASAYVDGLGWAKNGQGRPFSIFPGAPVGDAEWPREGAIDYYGRDIPSNVVPAAVTNAAYEAAWAAQSGVDLNRSVSADQVVTRERVDVIEVQYADTSKQGREIDTRPIIPAVMDALAPVLSGGENPHGLTMIVA